MYREWNHNTNIRSGTLKSDSWQPDAQKCEHHIVYPVYEITTDITDDEEEDFIDCVTRFLELTNVVVNASLVSPLASQRGKSTLVHSFEFSKTRLLTGIVCFLRFIRIFSMSNSTRGRHYSRIISVESQILRLGMRLLSVRSSKITLFSQPRHSGNSATTNSTRLDFVISRLDTCMSNSI